MPVQCCVTILLSDPMASKKIFNAEPMLNSSVRFFDVFRGKKKGAMGTKGLIVIRYVVYYF